MVWGFAVFREPISAVIGYESSAASAVRQFTDVLVATALVDTVVGYLAGRSAVPAHRLRLFALPTCGVLLAGLVSSFAAHAPVGVTALGAWDGLRLWMMLWLSATVLWRPTDYERAYDILVKVGGLIAVLGVVDYFGNHIVSTTLHTNLIHVQAGAYRSSATQSILATPGDYDVAMTLLIAITAGAYATTRRRSDALWLMLFVAASILSLRLKGAISLPVIFAVVICVPTSNLQVRNRARLIAVGVATMVVAIGFEGNVLATQASEYTSSTSTARALLYSTSVKIARDRFPLGVGFGRFGSDPSRTTYSPVYGEYGISNVWGLSQAYPQFITDTAWPSLLGETGVLGLAVYLVGIAAVAVALYRRARASIPLVSQAALTGLAMIAALGVNSLGDPALSLWIPAGMLAVVIGPALLASDFDPATGGANLESAASANDAVVV